MRKLSWDIYIIIFYIKVFLVFMVILNFLYVAISYRMKRLTFMQPVHSLRMTCSLMTTVAFIPVTSKHYVRYS